MRLIPIPKYSVFEVSFERELHFIRFSIIPCRNLACGDTEVTLLIQFEVEATARKRNLISIMNDSSLIRTEVRDCTTPRAMRKKGL